VWPALAVRVQDTVAVDDGMISVLKQGKIEFSGESLLDFLDELLGVLVAVDAHRQDLRVVLLFLGQKALQLPELFRAVRSPVAAIKDQNHIFLTGKA